MEIQTHKKDFFHANMKSIQEKEKEAVWDPQRAQRKQHSVKCLRRQFDNLVPFNYTASNISAWQIEKDMTSWSELNPDLPPNCGQLELTNNIAITQRGVSALRSSSLAAHKL